MVAIGYKAGCLAALVFSFWLTPRAEASLLVPFISDINIGVGGVRDYGLNGAPEGGLAPTAALSGPVQAIVGPDHNIYVTSIGSGEVLRYDGQTGAFIDAFISGVAHDSSGGFDVGPLSLAFGPNGDLYVTNDLTNEVERYNGTTGALVATFGSSHLSSPTGLVFDGSGNLYVASYNDNTIQEFVASTGAFVRTLTSVGLVDIGFGLGGPEQLTIGPNGNLFVADFNSSDVEEYDLATGNPVNGGIFVGGGSGGLAGATGLVFASDGGLFVASNFTDQILRYNGTTGSFTDVALDANSTPYIEIGFLTEVPEPATTLATLCGLAALAFLFRKRKTGQAKLAECDVS
jgi:WD40 repeat protein